MQGKTKAKNMDWPVYKLLALTFTESEGMQQLQAMDTTSGFTLIEEDSPAGGVPTASSSSPARHLGGRSSQSSSAASNASGVRPKDRHPSMADMQKSIEQQSAAVSLAVAQVLSIQTPIAL